jgi:hypothetical protein
LIEIHLQIVAPELHLSLTPAGLRDELEIHLGRDARHQRLDASAARLADGGLEPSRDGDRLSLPLDQQRHGVPGPRRVRVECPQGRDVDEPKALVGDFGDADLHDKFAWDTLADNYGLNRASNAVVV